MKTSNLKKKLTGIVALAFLVSGWAQADYVMHGRVSYDAGNTLVKGANEADWSNASINTLILSSDTLWVDSGGTAEVEFPGGNFLRMADASKVEVQSVSPTLALRGWTGSFYVQRIQRSTGDVVLETPAGSIRVAQDTNLRVDVLEDGATAITVRWGVATVRAMSGHESDITAGRRVWVEPGMLPSEAVRFSSNNDDAFDHWNRERAEWLAQGPGDTPVPVSDKAIGVSDLNRYGEWVVVDNRSYWRPTVVTEYVPYRHGRWSYTAGIGHVWVGMYPFSYATTHHGYWDYMPSHGWVWSYHDTWSPAWVATVRYGDYFMWSPVNRYHRPIMVSESAYFNIGGVQFSYHASSYAQSNYLYWGPSRVYPTYGSSFQNVYNTGNVTNINIWNINVSGRDNHVRVPYDRDFAQMTRNYNPSRTIRGTVSSPTDRGRSAYNRVSALESRMARDSFSVRSRETAGNVRTAIDSNRAAQGRTVRMQEETPSYLRDIRSGRTVNAEEVRASVRDRQATPTARGTGSSVRGGAGTTQERGTTVRDGRQAPAGQERVTRAPETDRGAASSVRSGVTERSSVGRETPDRSTVRQQPTATDRSSAPGRSTVPERSSVGDSRGSTVRQTPTQSQPRATTPERTAPRDRVQVGSPTSRGNAASSDSSRTSTTRSSVRSQDERPRATTTPSRPSTSAQTPNRSTAPTTPRATTPNRTQERVAPQSQQNRSQPQAQTPDRSPNVRTAPSAPRSQATATPAPQRTAPSATNRSSNVSRPDTSRPNVSAPNVSRPNVSRPNVSTPNTSRSNVSAPRAQTQRQAPSAQTQRQAPSAPTRQPAATRSAPSRDSSSITPRSLGGNRPGASSSSSAPSRPNVSSGSTGRGSASVSAPSRPSTPRGSAGAPARGSRR